MAKNTGGGGKKVDIAGQRFHRLVALYPLKSRYINGSVIWRCHCDCGNEIDVAYNHLVYGNLRSCGCQKKEHDKKLPGFLTHIDGTSLEAVRSKKIPTDNTTGYKGVYLIRGKYVAKIVFQKKQYYLGAYDDIEEAAEVRQRAEEVLFDGFVDYYERWQAMAAENDVWAAANPIKIQVIKDGAEVAVRFWPELAAV